MVSDIQELLQVLVNDQIFWKRGFGFHAGFHLFCIILVVLAEHLHQCMAAVFQSEKGILHFFSRHKIVTLHDFLIVPVDAHTHLVKQAVCFKCGWTSSRDTSAFRVPQFWIDRKFAAELRLRSVHCDTSHNRYCTVFLHCLSFQVEDNWKCTLHRSKIFLVSNLVREESFVATQIIEEYCNSRSRRIFLRELLVTHWKLVFSIFFQPHHNLFWAWSRIGNVAMS